MGRVSPLTSLPTNEPFRQTHPNPARGVPADRIGTELDWDKRGAEAALMPGTAQHQRSGRTGALPGSSTAPKSIGNILRTENTARQQLGRAVQREHRAREQRRDSAALGWVG